MQHNYSKHSAPVHRRREVMMAAALQDTFASGTAAEVTLTASEPGILRLCDSVLAVTAADIDLGGTDLVVADLTAACRVEAITLNGSSLLVRGRNTPSGPAVAFAVQRQANFFGLPDLKLETGDTVVVKVNLTRTNMGTAPIAFAAPFVPDRFRGIVDDFSIFGRGEFISSAPVAAIDGAGDESTITVTFDSPGFIDLGRGVLHGAATLGTTVAADAYDAYSHDNLPILIKQMILRSDYNMIVGQGTHVSSPNVLNAFRRRNFCNFGIHEVTAGDQLVITAEVQGTGTTIDGNAFFSVPQVLKRSAPSKC